MLHVCVMDVMVLHVCDGCDGATCECDSTHSTPPPPTGSFTTPIHSLFGAAQNEISNLHPPSITQNTTPPPSPSTPQLTATEYFSPPNNPEDYDSKPPHPLYTTTPFVNNHTLCKQPHSYKQPHPCRQPHPLLATTPFINDHIRCQ